MRLARYPVPAGPVRVQEEIRRSRFRTDLARASTEPDARRFIERVRAEDPRASHHCWAFLVGPPGSSARVACSDDGEPHGTAGQPMLTVLLHSGIGDVVAVCTRHFGGVKLGTGGLARAYGAGVRNALDILTTELKVERTRVRIRFDYADVESLRRRVQEIDAVLLDEAYGAAVVWICAVPEDRLAEFESLVAAATAGRARVER